MHAQITIRWADGSTTDYQVRQEDAVDLAVFAGIGQGRVQDVVQGGSGGFRWSLATDPAMVDDQPTLVVDWFEQRPLAA